MKFKLMRSIIVLSAMLVAAGIRSGFSQTEFVVMNAVTANTFHCSSFISDHEGWLADDQGILWHTTDGGLTWDTVFAGIQLTKLDFVDALNGFALSKLEAYKTSDGGKSWETLALQKLSSALCFINSSTGFISGKGEIYKTTDNGISWNTVDVEMFPVFIHKNPLLL